MSNQLLLVPHVQVRKDNSRNSHDEASGNYGQTAINYGDMGVTLCHLKNRFLTTLVGGWTNPSEKYARQLGSFPQGSGWKFKKCLKPPPSFILREDWGTLGKTRGITTPLKNPINPPLVLNGVETPKNLPGFRPLVLFAVLLSGHATFIQFSVTGIPDIALPGHHFCDAPKINEK